MLLTPLFTLRMNLLHAAVYDRIWKERLSCCGAEPLRETEAAASTPVFSHYVLYWLGSKTGIMRRRNQCAIFSIPSIFRYDAVAKVLGTHVLTTWKLVQAWQTVGSESDVFVQIKLQG